MSNGYESGKILIVFELNPSEEWNKDSGYTFHMTPRRDWLFKFKQIAGGKVLMGNDKSYSVISIGYLRFKL